MAIRFITTGGTIDKIYFDDISRFEVGDPRIGDMLREANATFPFVVETILKKDSLHMTDEDRQLVRSAVEKAPETQIVITHGTDTMIETARKLVGIEGKTIVLTGALNPARFHQTDAVFNIGMAVAAAQTLPPGVYIGMNGQIFDPLDCRKNREANRFEGTPVGPGGGPARGR